MTKKEFKRKHAAHEFVCLGTTTYRRSEEAKFEADLEAKIKALGGVSALKGTKTTRCEVDGANCTVSVDRHGLTRVLSCWGNENIHVTFYKEATA